MRWLKLTTCRNDNPNDLSQQSLHFPDQPHHGLPTLVGRYSQDSGSPDVHMGRNFPKREVQSTNKESDQQSNNEYNFSQIQQNNKPELFMARNEASDVQRVPGILQTSETLSQGQLSTNVQPTTARPVEPSARRKLTRKSDTLREYEPRDESSEPGSDAASEKSQLSTRGSSRPTFPTNAQLTRARPNRKPKRDSRISRGLQGHKKSPQPELEHAQEDLKTKTPRTSREASRRRKRKSKMLREHNERDSRHEREDTRRKSARPSRPASRKTLHKSSLLREIEAYNKSPEPRSDHEQKEGWRRTVRSSRSASASAKPQRKSMLLRELEPHNKSPEPAPKSNIAKLGETQGVYLTRGMRQDIADKMSGNTPTPKKNLNVADLIVKEFSGKKKGTKTFYAEDDGNLGHSSHEKQSQSEKDKDHLFTEDEDEEAYLPEDIQSDDWSDSQPLSERRTGSRHVKKSVEDGQPHHRNLSESPSLMRDSKKR